MKTDRFKLSLSLSLFLLAPAWLLADNWPQFRGPHQGHSLETGLPLKWSATENVLWKTPLPGPGHSSPVIWGDRVFLTAFKSAATSTLSRLLGSVRGQLLVLALDKDTGEVLWEREVPADEIEGTHRTNAPASPTPVTDGEHVYVYFGSRGLTAFDFDGKKVWEKRLGPFPNQWGSASSPVLYGDMLLLIVDTDAEDFLLAVDKKTGKTIWKTSRSNVVRSWSVPLIWNVDGKDQIVVSGSRTVKGYNAKDGRELWKLDGLTKWVTPMPVSAHGLLFVTSNGPGGNVVLAIRPGGRGDITGTHVAWRYQRSAPYISSPVVVGDYLYLVKNGGIMTCLAAKTGKLAWQERLPGRGNYYASLVAGDGRIYAVSEDGEVTVVAAKPDFQVLATNAMGERTMATPSVSDRRIFIRTDESLFAIGAARSSAGVSH
jgi:outer membrane protein assembly factor BamB